MGDFLEEEEEKGGNEGEQSESRGRSTIGWGFRRRYCK